MCNVTKAPVPSNPALEDLTRSHNSASGRLLSWSAEVRQIDATLAEVNALLAEDGLAIDEGILERPVRTTARISTESGLVYDAMLDESTLDLPTVVSVLDRALAVLFDGADEVTIEMLG